MTPRVNRDLLCFICLQIKLVNISSNDIVDGNVKLVLGLVWSIILHWQVRMAYTRVALSIDYVQCVIK